MTGRRTTQPFVLLDDARTVGAAPSRLFTRPGETIVAHAPGEVPGALDRLRRLVDGGATVAGYIGYGAGHALEPRLGGLASAPPADAPPLLWFAAFSEVEPMTPGTVDTMLPDPAGAWLSRPTPRWDAERHAEALARTQALIAAGDIYQANVSLAADVRVLGHPLAAYARLRATARAGWGGVLFTGTHWLLSASPELFFALEDGVLTARPMKGTAARGLTEAEDAAAAHRLAADAKERAENLMIVDLLRNDLSRIAQPGSVAVPRLFDVETYPTVHQMTSSVTARIADRMGPVDALAALFPCGSVTGAPKIRAMEVIAEVEDRDRGPYTGSMGWMSGGSAGFNVLIRTLVLADGSADATLGLGSGVVADSTAAAEWRECLSKGGFVTESGRAPDLIETMRFDPYDGIERLALHLERLVASARTFGIPVDRHAIRNELQGATFALQVASRVRLVLGAEGGIAIETGPLPPAPAEPVAVSLIPLPVHPSDYRLRHKTTDRRFHAAAHRAGGTFEIVYERPDGALSEGSFTNLFVERDGRLLTPAASLGLLPGILRRALIEEGRAVEATLTRADLAEGFLIGNALRGLMRARLVDRPGVGAL